MDGEARAGTLEKVQEIMSSRTPFWHMEFEMSLGHLRGRVCRLINEAMYLKAVSCKTHSGNVFIMTASNIVT